MPDPTVCCVLLTANRPEMARQAVESFRRQTYDPVKRMLMILDTGDPEWFDPASDAENEYLLSGSQHAGKTVGELRNITNECARADILCHWDDDDYSHPNRIAEQVALLQASGAQACGYNQMLFWREGEPPRYGAISDYEPARLGEAWLYTGSTICGTSLCYWRTAWERKHFEAMNNGEDTRWLMGMKTAACSSIVDDAPRMAARIHSGNTSNAYNPQVMRAVEKQGGEWRRVSEWDEHCRKVFA